MKSNLNRFKKTLYPIDKFYEKVLYDKEKGYYATNNPFGYKGDFVTAPNISDIFSEIIGIWIISSWEKLGKPRTLNLVELGPGDGSLTKILLRTFKKFPTFNSSVNIFMYEKSDYLIRVQKKKIKDKKVRWIDNFKNIKKGPVIFFGNEFFDAIPIKQFLKNDNVFLEKHYTISNKKIYERFKIAKQEDERQIKSFKSLLGLNLIEYPKLGLIELKKIVKKVSTLSGGILLIDYGYIKPQSINTLQSLMKHKKNNILKNIFKADITCLVNFALLKEYFLKNKLYVKNIVTQKFFLEKMGIIERANILKKKMNTSQKKNLDERLYRLLNKDIMGELFKVIFAFKSTKKDFLGFD